MQEDSHSYNSLRMLGKPGISKLPERTNLAEETVARIATGLTCVVELKVRRCKSLSGN